MRRRDHRLRLRKPMSTRSAVTTKNANFAMKTFSHSVVKLAVSALALVTAVWTGGSSAITFLNPTLDTPTYSADNWYQNPSGASVAWTFTGVSGIRYFNYPDGANGRQAAYLAAQGTAASLGRMSQTVDLPAGTYQIRYLMARGAGNDNGGSGAAQPIQFQVGKTAGTLANVGAVQYPRWYSYSYIQPIYKRAAAGWPESMFETWWTQPFTVLPADAGPHILSFVATDQNALESQDSVTYLDQLTIVQAPSGQFSNGSFEALDANGTTPTGWTVLGAAQSIPSSAMGRDGNRSLIIKSLSNNGYATQAVTVAQGRYSVSARIRKDAESVEACAVNVVRIVGSTSTALGTLVPPVGVDFVSTTTASFDLTAGTHNIRFEPAPCAANQRVLEIDSVTLNNAGPTFGNANFETPDARVTSAPGYHAPQGERGAYRDNPTGASWTFQSGSGISRNPIPPSGGLVYSTPSTTDGAQFAYLFSNSGVEQSVALDPGRYVVTYVATSTTPNNMQASGTVKVKVNGTTVSTAPAFRNYDLSMTERMSAPFDITSQGNYTIRLEGNDAYIVRHEFCR